MLRRFSPFLLAALAASSLVFAQDPSKERKPDEEVAARIGVLVKCVKDRKMARDVEGREAIDFLLVKLRAGLCDKDRKAVTKAIETVLFKGKVRPPEKMQLYTAAVMALGFCGKDGAKALVKAYESKRFGNRNEKKWVPLREKMLQSIGRTKDESKVKFLLDEARRNPEDALMAAAGEALGNFDDSKEKIRKGIVSDLIKRWGELSEKATQLGPGNIEAGNARNTLAAISDKWNRTMSRLTGQKFTRFLDWQRWYNNNKGKRWK